MPCSRRDFLLLAGMVASGALVSCSPLEVEGPGTAADALPHAQIRNRDYLVLRRLTYGPGPREHNEVAKIGLAGWIENQLSVDENDDQGLKKRLWKFDHLDFEANALVGWKKQALIADLQQAALLRKLYSPNQLYEMMVEFWSDHFNIAVAKGDCWFLKVEDDRKVIRPHALGNFHDLLWASAHSPAMLVYLDNQANHRNAPNENYARELMELHTLGVDGGYGQNDVMELARCLTGWSVKNHFWRGQFHFDPDLHDPDPKTVLGLRIEPAGIREAERVLEDLAAHPATARHIAAKLVRRFVTDDPLKMAPLLVDRVARTFKQTRGDIRATLRCVLLDGLLPERMPLHPKYKRPLDFLVSGLRGLAVESDGGPDVHHYLYRMGQPFYEWPTPAGAPDYASAWLGNLMPRWQFALALAGNEIPGTDNGLPSLLTGIENGHPGAVLDRLSMVLLGAPLASGPREDLLSALKVASPGYAEDFPSAIAAGLVASPAFQWR